LLLLVRFLVLLLSVTGLKMRSSVLLARVLCNAFSLHIGRSVLLLLRLILLLVLLLLLLLPWRSLVLLLLQTCVLPLLLVLLLRTIRARKFQAAP
jgi:hypothetical protein